LLTLKKEINQIFLIDVFNDTVNCVSPGGEIIVFGHNNKIITFTCKFICVCVESYKINNIVLF